MPTVDGELRLPRHVCGLLRTVRSTCAVAARRVAAGGSLVDAYGPGDVPAVQAPGLLVLDGPSPLLQPLPHTHVYLPHAELWQRIDLGSATELSEERVFDESLQLPWAVLALTGPANQIWLFPGHRHRPFLRAVLRFWPALTAADGRYSGGGLSGGSLWETGTNIRYALGHLGAPVDQLTRSLEADAAAELLHSTLTKIDNG
ncbi:hypothetical protein [Streptomyces sp. NPDC001530]|uniref:hypothetical protein n=1 Tax=Streptomyces sp. NPDC001530 TaxID=3364582 RepID=UPI0036B590D8